MEDTFSLKRFFGMRLGIVAIALGITYYALNYYEAILQGQFWNIIIILYAIIGSATSTVSIRQYHSHSEKRDKQRINAENILHSSHQTGSQATSEIVTNSSDEDAMNLLWTAFGPSNTTTSRASSPSAHTPIPANLQTQNDGISLERLLEQALAKDILECQVDIVIKFPEDMELEMFGQKMPVKGEFSVKSKSPPNTQPRPLAPSRKMEG